MPGMIWKAAGVRRFMVLGSAALALAGPGAAMPAQAQAMVATGVGTPFELAFWQSIDSSSDASLYEAYLTRFPGGTFSEIARAKIITLRGRGVAPPVPVASPPPAVSPSLTVPVVPVVQPAPAPPVAPAPVAPAPVMAQPAFVTPAAVNTAAPAAASAGTLGQLLAALASSQANGAAPEPVQVAATAPAPVAPHTLAAGFTLPPQPALSPVPQVALPPSFCSAAARNAFHDAVYAPSVTAAKANNDAAAAYMHQLQSLYDHYQLSHDPDTMNTIVGAARTYSQVAQTTFSMQAALVRQFTALMAVPVVACSQPGQPPATTLIK